MKNLNLTSFAVRLSRLVLLPSILLHSYVMSASALTWGACGHPGNGPVWIDPAAQLSLLKARNLKTYRFDVSLSDDQPNTVSYLDRMVALAEMNHIVLHPILFVPFTYGDSTDHGRYPDTDEGLEAQGYQRVYPVVTRYAGRIQDWELENELTLLKGFKSGDGLLASDYNTPLAHRWAAVLRGMSRAIADVSAKTGRPLRTVVDAVYVDFGFVPFLEGQGVTVSKFGYHYYYSLTQDPRNISAPHATVDIFALMAALRKPIIINEFNAGEIYSPNQGIPYNDPLALKSLRTHIEYLLSQKEVELEGVEYYELFDEPGKGPVESNFGLMKDAKTPKLQMLLAAFFACGSLSDDERATLMSSGVFAQDSSANTLAACGSH